MNKIQLTSITPIILLACLSKSLAFIDMNEVLTIRLSNQLEEADNKIVLLTESIKKEFLQKGTELVPGKYEFCSTVEDDGYCKNKTDEVQLMEKSTIIRSMAWGFVDESLVDAELSWFDKVGFEYTTFNQHLCIEIHFKDNKQIAEASPIFTNKTIAFCAFNRDGKELIDLRLVSGDEMHAKIVDGPEGWKCINPHNSLGNGGSGLGYSLNNGVITKTKLIGRSYLSNCLRDEIKNIS